MRRQRKANMKRRNGRTCKLCVQDYDRDERRARILPCGHTLCTKCVSNNIKKNHLQCPTCRRKHQACVATHFPVNIELEKLILGDTPSSVTDSEDCVDLHPVITEPPNRALDLSDDMNEIFVSMREEIVRNLKRPGANMKEVKEQLQQYRSLVARWKEHHRKSMETYKSISRELEEMIESLQMESEKVSKALEEGRKETAKLKIAKEKLEAAQTDSEVIPAILEAGVCYDVVLNWNLQAQKNFPDGELSKKSDMLKEKTEKVLMAYSAIEKRLAAATEATDIVEKAGGIVAVGEADDPNAANPA